MTNAVRQLSVNELSRILPMVREVMQTDYYLWSLTREIQKKESRIGELSTELETFSNFFSLFETQMDKAIRDEMKKIKQNKQDEKARLEASIANDKNAEEESFGSCDLKIKLYLSITATISTDGGFLGVSDIQEDFLKEYIYLLAMANSWSYQNHKIGAAKIFVSVPVFYGLVRKSFPEKQEEILQALEKRQMHREKFFDIFGEEIKHE